jgi:hypothetical protein
MQPTRELAARNSKENQGKRLGFSLDSFGRIGTFQRVTEKKIKKFAAG